MDVKEGLQILKSQGYKYTDKREEILRVFTENPGYITAKFILDQLKDRFEGFSFDTIYRNLTLYVQVGILEETEWDGEKHYQLRCCLEHHLHHIICTECGVSLPLEICPMEQISASSPFKITGHKFEIYGLCANCQ